MRERAREARITNNMGKRERRTGKGETIDGWRGNAVAAQPTVTPALCCVRHIWEKAADASYTLNFIASYFSSHTFPHISTYMAIFYTL